MCLQYLQMHRPKHHPMVLRRHHQKQTFHKTRSAMGPAQARRNSPDG